jgi:phenylacetate-coenzyme A ligase PaaK-like adenylate-forming protein
LEKLEDLQTLPFTTEKMLADMPGRFLLTSQAEVSRVISGATSGTTGPAKRVFYTERDTEHTVGFFAAGISEMRFRPFLLAATVGRSPGMLGSLLIGHFFGRKNYTAMIILSIAVAIILIICFIKRESLIAFLDKVEARDAEREEQNNG